MHGEPGGAVPPNGPGADRRSERATSLLTAEAAPLSGADIVCFAHTAWHGPWKASQQIMSLIAETNRVLYVGPCETLGSAIKRLRGGAGPAAALERVGGAMFVYHGPWFLGRVREDRVLGPAYNRVSAWMRMMHTRYVAWRLGFRNPILWIFDPLQAEAARRFRARLLVYHMLDNYVEFPQPDMKAERAAIARSDAHLLKTADLVFAVSRRLHERCLQYNPNSFLVPNGVNYDRFQSTIAAGADPADMRAIPRPIIGYVGVIQEDMDFALLHQLAQDLPSASLVFVGPEDLGRNRPKFEALLAHGNVHYLGAKAVEDVPLYIRGCDVCILPQRADQAVVDSDQIKLYEYLACGRPIVSTDLPSVERFSPLVRIARNADEFVAQVRASLTEHPGRAELRTREARQHSWRTRVDAIGEAFRRRTAAPARAGGAQR
jgi:glycosyltransferase involved in cell wall biosynthesis